MNKLWPILASLCVLAMMIANDATAIPAFARKYNMSCLTCHAPFPKLKAYANEFANNGFQLADKEPPRAFRDTGDDWLLLMRELPLALRFDGFIRWLPQSTGQADIETPYALKILSGGQISKHVSYYLYFLFNEAGEVGGVEDAFIMFNNVFSSDLDIYVGQFQVSDPLFKRELRLTLEDYRIFTVRPGSSHIDLTYDRGIVLRYGLQTETELLLQLVNGSGIGPSGGDGAFDSDKYKNLMGRVSQQIGEHVRLGVFGYFGKEEQVGRVNSLWMAGPDFTVSLGKFELNAQYVERQDDDPLFVDATDKTKTRGAFGELVFLPDGDASRVYLVGLWNWGEQEPLSGRYQTATGHVGYMISRNFRLTGEYTYDFIAKANLLTLGFVTAF